jgi:hypothetical protein
VRVDSGKTQHAQKPFYILRLSILKLKPSALFVLTKIDQILAWERQKEVERDTRFRRSGQVSVRGAGGTVLEAGEARVV